VILPDLLSSGLRVVFCGSAAGTASAMAGAYYAGPGNRFWSILHKSGLTPRRLAPSEFGLLPEWGIGLTDVCKTAYGMDHEIAADAFDPARLRMVLDEIRPHAVAFNGKTAARLAFGLRDSAPIDLGPTVHTLGAIPAWVLPSTSGANARYWDAAPWHALAAALPQMP
jgi:TDG/mug DNA glycosylase family protein